MILNGQKDWHQRAGESGQEKQLPCSTGIQDDKFGYERERGKKKNDDKILATKYATVTCQTMNRLQSKIYAEDTVQLEMHEF